MLARPPSLQGALETLSGSPACGLQDLDTAAVLRPGALTLVDVSGPASDVLYAWMADAGVLGRLALVADGANFLDVYRLATAARRRAAARLPDATRSELAAYEEIVLERVRVARGFTAHQIQAIVEDGLVEAAGLSDASGRFAERPENPRTREPETEDGPRVPGFSGGSAKRPVRETEEIGLIVAPGLLEMYLDEELSREESRALAGRALSTLRRLAARLHAPAIVSNSALSPTSDHPLRILLDESVDEQVILRTAPHGGMAIHLPRRGAMFLSPGPGRTRLEDFLEPEERATPIRPILARKPGEWVSNGNRMYGKFGEARRREPWAVHAAREAA